MKTVRRTAVLSMMALALSGCAGMGLEQVLQAPTFRVDGSQQAQLRLLGPSAQNPLGGAAVRLYARVGNPNPVGLTLTRLVGQLQLQGSNAARVDFPLGVPLQAGGETRGSHRHRHQLQRHPWPGERRSQRARRAADQLFAQRHRRRGCGAARPAQLRADDLLAGKLRVTR